MKLLPICTLNSELRTKFAIVDTDFAYSQATQRDMAEREAKVQAEIEVKTAEERVAWEKKVNEEKKAVLAAYEAAQVAAAVDREHQARRNREEAAACEMKRKSR